MKKILILLTTVVLMYSCVSNKKIVVAKTKVTGFEAQVKSENAEINKINKLANVKLQANKIDSNILVLINRKLPKATARLDTATIMTNQLNEILKDDKKTKRNYRSIVLPALDSLQQIKDEYAMRLALYEMISDGLNVADYKQFNLAAFFGPGKYNIPEDKVEIARLSFEPLLDSLIHFSNKYSQYPRTATIVFLGFADGMGITADSELYYTLLKELNKQQATKAELNLKLSDLRARELIGQMTAIYLKKAPDFINGANLKVEYLFEGKGEAYPISKIKDYTTDDERRRIVLAYWIVLPD